MTARHARRGRSLRPASWAILLISAVIVIPAGVVAGRSTPSADRGRPDTPSSAAVALGRPPLGLHPSGTRPTPTPTSARRPSLLAADRPAAQPGAGPCVSLRVLASLENAAMVRAVARGYTAQPRDVGGHCVRVQVVSQSSGDAEAAAATGFAHEAAARRPTVWLPDSVAWLRIARAAAGRDSVVPTRQASIARSDVVLAMPAPLARAIGWTRRTPSWGTVFRTVNDTDVWRRLGHPDWGTFKIGKAAPTLATSGLMALTASFLVANGVGSPLTVADVHAGSVLRRVRTVEQATSHYMSTPQHFLEHAREAVAEGSIARFLSALITDETTVWNYNRGVSVVGDADGGRMSAGGAMRTVLAAPPRQKLTPIYPSEGVLVATDPAAVLDAPWVTRRQHAAAADFLRYARTIQGQRVVRANGFRDVEGNAAPAVARVASLQRSAPVIPTPRAQVLSAVERSFPDVRKRARVMFLLDVSGSMKHRITPHVTKLDAAKHAVIDAMRYFGDDDEMGLAAFSNDSHGPIRPGTIAPVAPLTRDRSGLVAAIDRIRAGGETPLYRAVDTFVGAMTHGYDASRINAVVLLSDGHNDTTMTETRAHLLRRLGVVHRRTPILVFTIGYGHAADVASLTAIADATGAHYYDATDPDTIDHVLTDDLVTSL